MTRRQLCPFSNDLSWIDRLLAVSGRPACTNVASCLRREHEIALVIDLRAEERDDPRALAREGIDFLHLPTADHAAVPEEKLSLGVERANKAMLNDERVLIHCEHGIGRSVLLAACVLVSRGRTPLEAIRRLKGVRPVASPSPDQLHALLAWSRSSAAGWDELASVAYSHLRRDAR